jgi:ribonuclease E
MKKEMLINVLQPEECRIAIVEDGVLEELYVERTSNESYTGNIYKGKIVNIEPAIQAAFVDFSVGRNGFLHVSDVEPQYFHRHATAEDETDARPRDRDRGKKREPRRDRDRGRGREERRGAPAEPLDEIDPFGLLSSRGEDRPRERGEDRPRERGEDRPRERGEDRPRERGEDRPRERGRERERPDQSVRGRRDRSEPPRRRFGEGLTDRGEEPEPPPVERFPSWEAPASEPSEPSPEPPVADARDWDREIGWEREPEYDRQPDRRPERESRVAEPEEPAGRLPERNEFFDPDLPPSRTDRSQTSGTRQRPAESEPERARYRDLPGFAPELEPGEPEEPPLAEPEAESFGGREPRRGRGRGRGRGRPSPVDREERPESEVESEPPLGPPEEPGFGEFPRGEEPPRRRGGRAAIRARGGEWERPREAPAPREPEAERLPDVDWRREPEPSEPPREREKERERPREREKERERPRAHGRAGEPGYVPRRERMKSGESAFGADLFPAETEWPEREAESPPEEVSESRIDGVVEEELGRPEDEGPGGARTEGRRRRRRRGRRRDREPMRETEEREATGPAPEDLEVDFEGFTEEREEPRPYARRHRREEESLGGFDELDLEEIEGVERPDLEEDEFALEMPRAAVEEEIDPELEQEIRKEIEEIEELEREMGLRGPEARGAALEEAARGGRGGARGRGLPKPPIQEVFRRGDEVLIQVIKESIGTKGPTLSTYISIPGRYLVLMPGLNRVGVSRKIVDEAQRRKLREIMNELNPPKGLGFIVRTAGLDRTKRELARDLAYLLRLWKVILRRIRKSRAPTPIYQESDMIIRTIRDIFTSEIDTIWIDEPEAFERAQDFLRVVMPRFVNRLKLYDEKVPLFHKYGIEEEIAKIQRRHVPLPEGGSIVIDQTEALVAIDVNSGNFRVEDDAEKTAYEMNLRAAREIARQLRLRDLGGVIVNDFIDMREERHRRGVERALREAIKRDRARTKVLRMSAFGLIEMTRQRIRPSLKRSIYQDCPQCNGAGVVKTAESMAIDVMRLLALATHREEIRRIEIAVHTDVATYLNNRKRREIARMEQDCSMSIQIGVTDDAPAEHLIITCFDANGNEVRLQPQPPSPHHHGHGRGHGGGPGPERGRRGH